MGTRNKYYEVPHSLSSVFTGRDSMCRKLSESCLPSQKEDVSSVQKRFVLCGLGGSGKTQICLKFAQDHRDKYVRVSLL